MHVLHHFPSFICFICGCTRRKLFELHGFVYISAYIYIYVHTQERAHGASTLDDTYSCVDNNKTIASDALISMEYNYGEKDLNNHVNKKEEDKWTLKWCELNGKQLQTVSQLSSSCKSMHGPVYVRSFVCSPGQEMCVFGEFSGTHSQTAQRCEFLSDTYTHTHI